MQYDDERDPREDRREPDDREADAPQPPPLADEAVDAGSASDEADEFETASWPHHDGAAEAEPATERAPEPGPAGPAAQEPPPPDVEAYPPAAEAAAPAAEAAEASMPAHSVPATEPGESTLCPRCGTENRPGISFCRNCGQRLVAAGAPTTVARPAAPEGTQACPRCGTHNRAGVAFCQNCGANLRGAEPGYVPPAAPAAEVAGADAAAEAGRALLGPIVLLIGAIGIATGWALPFRVGDDALFDQAFGANGYGIAFWSAYDGISTLAAQAYFGFAAPAPLLVLLLVALAIGGFLRPAPAALQLAGLLVALAWAIGLVALFVLVELVGGPGGELLDILRALSPGGIILMLASLIVVIGALTRLGRG